MRLTSIGQGDTVITPLKLAQMYVAIANGGTIWQPTVAQAIVKTDGTLVKEIKPQVLGKLPAMKSTLVFLRDAFAKLWLAAQRQLLLLGFQLQ